MNLNFTVTTDGVDIVCQNCHQPYFIKGVTAEQIQQWKGGSLIQKVMPQVPAPMRELFISGECPACWDALFANDDEDDY